MRNRGADRLVTANWLVMKGAATERSRLDDCRDPQKGPVAPNSPNFDRRRRTGIACAPFWLVTVN